MSLHQFGVAQVANRGPGVGAGTSAGGPLGPAAPVAQLREGRPGREVTDDAGQLLGVLLLVDSALGSQLGAESGRDALGVALVPAVQRICSFRAPLQAALRGSGSDHGLTQRV